ncbi:hypothetical protein CBL_21287, partial [Carabus blaptoides fortunei]
ASDTSIQETSEENPEITAEVPQESACSSPQPAEITARPAEILKRGTSQKNRKKKAKLDDSLDNVVEVLRNQTITNEFTVFGQHVTSQLQCLPLEEALRLQEGIHSLITSTRLRSDRGSRSTPNSARPDSQDVYASDTIYLSQSVTSGSVGPFSPDTENLNSFYINWTDSNE